MDETIRTSLMQFDRLGMCKINTFGNSDGTATSFISVPAKYKEKIDKQLDLLANYLSLSNENIDIVEEEVAKAIDEASVVYLAKM